MDPRLHPVAEIFRLNTRLLLNCLDGLDDEAGLRRPNDRTNHIAFLAAHLVGSRAWATGKIGGDGTDPFEDRLGAAGGIEEVLDFPSLEEVRAARPEVTGC